MVPPHCFEASRTKPLDLFALSTFFVLWPHPALGINVTYPVYLGLRPRIQKSTSKCLLTAPPGHLTCLSLRITASKAVFLTFPGPQTCPFHNLLYPSNCSAENSGTVLDSSLSNPPAHFIFNSLYLHHRSRIRTLLSMSIATTLTQATVIVPILWQWHLN